MLTTRRSSSRRLSGSRIMALSPTSVSEKPVLSSHSRNSRASSPLKCSGACTCIVISRVGIVSIDDWLRGE
jgi:hypothetical protein